MVIKDADGPWCDAVSEDICNAVAVALTDAREEAPSHQDARDFVVYWLLYLAAGLARMDGMSRAGFAAAAGIVYDDAEDSVKAFFDDVNGPVGHA